MSLLQETHGQYGTFENGLSCPEINIGNELNANSVVTTAFQLVTTPTAGFVLTSDAEGNGTWGVGALPAFGYAAGNNVAAVAAATLIPFNLGAAVFPNTGFVAVPAVNGTVYQVQSAGRYEFNFRVVAADAAGLTVPIEVSLDVNGVSAGNGYTFQSDLATADAGVMVCAGSGLILLAANALVGIRNITAVGATAIAFAAFNNNTNRTLTLKRIA